MVARLIFHRGEKHREEKVFGTEQHIWILILWSSISLGRTFSSTVGVTSTMNPLKHILVCVERGQSSKDSFWHAKAVLEQGRSLINIRLPAWAGRHNNSIIYKRNAHCLPSVVMLVSGWHQNSTTLRKAKGCLCRHHNLPACGSVLRWHKRKRDSNRKVFKKVPYLRSFFVHPSVQWSSFD